MNSLPFLIAFGSKGSYHHQIPQGAIASPIRVRVSEQRYRRPFSSAPASVYYVNVSVGVSGTLGNPIYETSPKAMGSHCGKWAGPLVSLISAACGVVLLAAVYLKVQGMTSGAGQPLAVFPPWVQLTGLLAEAIVGLWLLTGYARPGAWLAALVLFTALAVVSGYLLLVGQKSCGCFGRVEVSPWVSLTLDLTCAAALLLARPQGAISRRAVWQTALVVTSTVTLALIISLPVVGRQLARFRGEAIVLPDGYADLGSAWKEEVRSTTVVVENVSDEPIRLIGGTSTCSCASIYDLPQTIPPHSRIALRVAVRFTGDEGFFAHNFDWYTDSPSQPRVSGRITGRVLGVRAEQPAG